MSATPKSVSEIGIAGLPETDVVEFDWLDDAILLVRMNRPKRLNALAYPLVEALHQSFDAIHRDKGLRCVVLTGAGRGFCAGADLQEGGDPEPEGRHTRAKSPTVGVFLTQEHLASLHERIHRCSKPVIAAVNGPAMGGGFSLSLASDIRFAAQSATFGARFIKVGVSGCDMGTSYFLPRLVGASRAAELMLTGRIFDAAEALDLGLVLDVVPDDRLLDRALETARQIRENPPLATWMTKETMWQTIDAPSLRFALDIENRTQVMCTGTGELQEAFQAFVEKRPPQWKEL